jgi:hypothetical protein
MSQKDRKVIMSKSDFLQSVRVARNLLIHDESGTGGCALVGTASHPHSRAAIWLTPVSVKSYRAEDFRELQPGQQQTLTSAVRAFEQVARHAPPMPLDSDHQRQDAKAALKEILAIVGQYLLDDEDASEIQTALTKLGFPSWVVNWDCETGTDEEGAPAVWVTLFVDETMVTPTQLGRLVPEMIPQFRLALRTAGLRHWPYIRVRTAREHMVG